MILRQIGVIIEAIVVFIILIKYILFSLAGDYSIETTNLFLQEILTFGIGGAIPLEVTLLQIFGIVGLIIIALDLIIFGE